MPYVRPCLRPSVPPFVTFYKRLHNCFVYEYKFTKPTFITFGVILKNKMAAWAVFKFFILYFSKLSYSGCVIVIVLNFSGEIDYYKRLLEKSVFGGCVCVCPDFSNSQDSFISFGDILWVILVTVLSLVVLLLEPLPLPAFTFLTKVSILVIIGSRGLQCTANL